MRARARALALPILAVALLASTPPASAGDRTPVSSLPKVPPTRDRASPPETLGVAGLAITTYPKGAYASIEARVKDGYCLVNRSEFGFQLQDSVGFEGLTSELWHFRETETSLRVEITGLGTVSEPRGLWAKSRASVDALSVGRHGGVAVWAFREANGDAVFVTRAATGGREARSSSDAAEMPTFPGAFSNCSHGAVRIQAPRLRTGGVAQLRGADERPKTMFIVDVSAAKLSRDPEPFLSLRIRRGE
jgi:hypothetical protein